eukprot:Blabericola_migrator_1__7093@NODE_359_length_9439_cov_107_095070_g287_i0_p9_GENE_NODE_359_length_9439_cov_107_095070_g287_i0NODE_359_length_9439_cov_107_095070_g287_i0_p9_ORF_typecomplete_len123_score25_23TIG/PF01833_24/4_2e07_NODE_359_length_9439_cov_107_095070_g287_i038134181
MNMGYVVWVWLSVVTALELDEAIQIISISPVLGPVTGGTRVVVKGFGLHHVNETLKAHLDVLDEQYHIVAASSESSTVAEFITPPVQLTQGSQTTVGVCWSVWSCVLMPFDCASARPGSSAF